MSRANKAQITTVRGAAGIASGAGEYQLAAGLWDLEARLRGSEEPVIDVPTHLRQEYMDELLELAHYGQEKARTWNGYARGLHRAIELIGSDVPTWPEVWASLQQQIAEEDAAMGSTDPFG